MPEGTRARDKKIGRRPAGRPRLNDPLDVRTIMGADGLSPNVHVRHLARPYSPEALTVLVEIMRDTDAPVQARLVAANGVLDRAWGKPKETLELDANVSSGLPTVLAGVSADDLRELLRAVRAADVSPVLETSASREGEKDESP